jgi:hypothetical protein
VIGGHDLERYAPLVALQGEPQEALAPASSSPRDTILPDCKSGVLLCDTCRRGLPNAIFALLEVGAK